MNKFLILGSDSFIGASFKDELGLKESFFTTRRKNILDQKNRNLLFYDLEISDVSVFLNLDIDVVLICSGITDIKFCQSHPVFSFNVNVIKTLELINYFISKKIFVIFLSTSSVFDGNIKFPNEKNVLNPSTIYGFQKSEVERLSSSILNANIFLAIVRITKVINFNREPFRTFIYKLKNAEEIFPFSDLTFSPVSLNYVTSSLLKIAKNREAGIYHLTGSEDINYYDFLKKISKFMKLNTELVKQGNAIDIKNRPLFTPKYASLGLTNKNLKLMIKSQPIEEVVKFLETT